MMCRLVKVVTEPEAGQGWHQRREAACTVSRDEEQGLCFRMDTHLYGGRGLGVTLEIYSWQ